VITNHAIPGIAPPLLLNQVFQVIQRFL